MIHRSDGIARQVWRALVRPSGALVLLALLLAAGTPARAQEPNQAAVVVQYGDGSVSTHCVDLPGETSTGFEVLLATGLDVIYQGGGMGARVCKIGPDGCPNPADCFCQCTGSACRYWSYWHLVEGAWQYSIVGASSYRVPPGSVEGWTWGIGTPSDAPQPPPISFEDVCGAATATPAPTATPTAPPTAAPTGTPTRAAVAPPASTPAGAATPTAPALPSPTPAPTETPTQPAAPAPAAPSGSSYLFLGAIGVVLAAVAVLVLRRRRT